MAQVSRGFSPQQKTVSDSRDEGKKPMVVKIPGCVRLFWNLVGGMQMPPKAQKLSSEVAVPEPGREN